MRSVLLLGGASETGLAVLTALDLGPGTQVVLAGVNSPPSQRPPGSCRRAYRLRCRPGTPPAVPHGAAAPRAAVSDVAAAGVLGDQAVAEVDPDETVRVLEVSLVGVAAVCVETARALLGQGHGTLVG